MSKSLGVVSVVLLVVCSQPGEAQVYDRIAFMSSRDTPSVPEDVTNWEIYSMNTDGSDQVNLTNREARDIDPAWSPDGTQIAFASDRTGSFQIHVMDSDGASQVQLTFGPGHHVWPAWSPDGLELAYSSDEQGGDFDL